MPLREWIQVARKRGASDLHPESAATPVVRVRGDLLAVGEVLAPPDVKAMTHELLGPQAWEQFTQRGSADLSLVVGGTRCRINLYRTIRGYAIAIRLLSPSVNDLRACNLHPDFRCLINAHSGLVVVSGPTGSGKTTTLAALLEEINASRACNIITLESPLEYLFSNRRSFIRQREIPTHSPSFEQGLIDSLRENPDVLVVGEMRTPEAMRLTLNAAETGHLVLATMHSATCAEAVTRLCMSFAPEIQGSVRAQLADCLVGVLCQRLDFIETHQLRVPRCELLLASQGARGTIRSGNFGQLSNVIQSGGDDGMWSFDRYQRWMSQHKEWHRPSAATAVVDDPPAAVAAPATTATPVKRTPGPTPGDNPEIVIDEEVDLSEIAELAKRIGDRTP
ncbi:MAG TPA: ATPase, T2SS/T4P/T4SS family [Steroidobacteraceae bacterium]|nr:ATPase, T2SS/T4P/T4SS family [Steroidobacteraceae bacterium]